MSALSAPPTRCRGIALLVLTVAVQVPVEKAAFAQLPVALNPNLEIRLLMDTVSADGAHAVRIAKDPRDGTLYYLKLNGNIYRLLKMPGDGTSTSVLVYAVADHGLRENVQGLALGPDGTIYVVGNTLTNSGNSTFASIVKGVPGASGQRASSLLAQTEPYPRSLTVFDHVFNGITVSPDGSYVYVNSGSRTDHGEEQSANGVFPGTREVPLTAKVLRLPAGGSHLFLPNDLSALRQAGYVFAEGTRNAFDLAFGPSGDLFGIDNGPDRDMSDELNWLREGLHYGFPWRMGGADNLQQFPDYNPANDPLLDPRFTGVFDGYYHNDPGFPLPPTSFAEPVINLGPDADKFRSVSDGSIEDASALGQSINTFTAHRTPLGLVFDLFGAMGPPFQNHGFLLSFTPGDPNGTNVLGPFYDPGQDLVDLDLSKLGNTNYQTRVTLLVSGFSQPVDAEIIANKIYVIEYGGNQSIWEIAVPPVSSTVILTNPSLQPDDTFHFIANGALPGQPYEVQSSTNLLSWNRRTVTIPVSSRFEYVESSSLQSLQQFYRVVQH